MAPWLIAYTSSSKNNKSIYKKTQWQALAHHVVRASSCAGSVWRGVSLPPYFCHEQGAAHFAAIHKVFGASNASKLLMHLPTSDRCEAAVTMSYEAQARLQDPIYGCVAHIFSLQQQVSRFYMNPHFTRKKKRKWGAQFPFTATHKNVIIT